MLRVGTAELEKQIHDHKVGEEADEHEHANESMDISQALGIGVERSRRKRKRFRRRNIMRNPGTKEG